MLWGAIIGDIVGSIYEFSNIKTKQFPFFPMNGYITDDSCMTIAVADALMKWKHDGGDLQKHVIQSMREIGHKYPNMGYGFGFAKWLFNKESEPYNSWVRYGKLRNRILARQDSGIYASTDKKPAL